MSRFVRLHCTGSLLGRVPRGMADRVRKRGAAVVTGDLGRGIVSLLDQGLVSGTSFATGVLIARFGTMEQLGVYYLALSLLLLLRCLQEHMIVVPYMLLCHRQPGPVQASYAGSSLVHQLALSAVSAAGLLVLAAVLALGLGPRSLEPVVWVLLAAGPLLLLREYLRFLALAHLKTHLAVLLDGTTAVLQVGGLLLLVRFEQLSVPAAYATMGAACGLACLGWFLGGWPSLRFVPSRFVDDWWRGWSLGKWALGSHLLGGSASYLLPWIVALARGDAATGLLAACSVLVGTANMFVIGWLNFLLPRAAQAFAEGGTAALRQVLGRAVQIFVVVLGVLCLLALALGEPLAVLVYGPQYSGTGTILAVLAVNVLVNSLGAVAGNGLWALRRPQANFVADAANLVVTLSAALILVPPWGALGAAIAALSGTLAGTTVRGITLLGLLNSDSSAPVPAPQGVEQP